MRKKSCPTGKLNEKLFCSDVLTVCIKYHKHIYIILGRNQLSNINLIKRSRKSCVIRLLTTSLSCGCSTKAENSTSLSFGPAILRPCQGGGGAGSAGWSGARGFSIGYPGLRYGALILKQRWYQMQHDKFHKWTYSQSMQMDLANEVQWVRVLGMVPTISHERPLESFGKLPSLTDDEGLNQHWPWHVPRESHERTTIIMLYRYL